PGEKRGLAGSGASRLTKHHAGARCLSPFFNHSRLTMLNVGLIGLGSEWEQRYRPALAKLQQRLRVRCVYAPVITHAEQVAVELGCDVAPGIMTLIEREDVRALLVLDTAWYSDAPARFACQVGKPAFLAGRLVHRLPIANALA